MPNEDFAASADGMAIVLDGVTASPGTATSCHHGTPWYVGKVAEAVFREARGHGLTESGGALSEILHRALSSVRGMHLESCDPDGSDIPSASLAMVRVGLRSVDFLVLNDCTVLLDVDGIVQVITDDRMARLDFPERRAVLADPTPRAYAALQAAKRALRNQPGGYWVAASDPQAARNAICGSRPRHAVRRIAILTDGVSCAVDRYGLLDWPELLDRLDRHGPEAVIGWIREREAGDPEGRRWPRSKTHDDATALVYRF